MLFPPPNRPATPHRVAVTGAGIVSALGVGWRANADGFRVGRRAFRPVTRFPVTAQRAKIAAEADLPERLPASRLTSRQERRLDHATRLLLHATREAWERSGWQSPEAVPLVLGMTSGGMDDGQAYFLHARQTPERRRGQPTRSLVYQAQTQGRWVAEALGLTGPIRVVSHACASGADAIGQAWEYIRRGHSPRALAGGYDMLSRLVFAGFDSLQALSTTTCRPFDAERDGLALGEGAAVLALEDWASARERGADILGELIGFGAALDLHHVAQPDPEGDATLAAMRAACAVADVTPAEVDYLNAHGTGTRLNDTAESRAIARWAGDAAARIPLSSTKAAVGHTLGAAGAIEAVVCLMTLREGWLPPETGIGRVEPACPCPLVREPVVTHPRVALSNSIGFGGANATLIFRRAG
jgi:3-oxoacyl-[acyl-carrier-protein] synthase II